MYTQLAEIPVPLSAAFLNNDVVQVTYSARNHQLNAKKTLTKIIPLKATTSVSLPIQDMGEIVAQVVSQSYKLRGNLREVKHNNSTKRFVEIWSGSRMGVSFEVTDFHQAFYSDEYVSTLTFSPSETALLYTAEANSPLNSAEDPYSKYRFKPSFGEGFGGKKRPHFFLLRWSDPTDADDSTPKPRLYEIHPEDDDILFGQGVFFPTPEENIIYATGYEYTSSGRLLGIKGCFNRPFGLWELHFQTQLRDEQDDRDEKKQDLIIYSARKISDSNSARSPRIVQEDSQCILYWLSSNAGGPHVSTTILQSLDITSLDAISPEIKSRTRTVISIPKVQDAGFPGLYPPYNLVTTPFLKNGTASQLVIQSQWASRTTILSVSSLSQTGIITDLTPPDSALFSWALLATDGKNRILCSRSSSSVPYQIVLGVIGENGIINWALLDQPDLAPDVHKALQTIRTSIHPIPQRHPVETIVIQSTGAAESSQNPPPLITVPHGGPHAGTTTTFSAANIALVLEGYTLSLPNYTGTTGYGQEAVYKLLGRCGTLDVEDVHASTLHVVNDLKLGRCRKGEIFVMGGSHGGFIAAHLISRYPDFYSAAIMRNPVISCGDITGTDIPDWYFSEFGFGADFPIQSSPPFSDLSSSITKSPTIPRSGAMPFITPTLFEGLYNASPSTALLNRLKACAAKGELHGRVAPVLLLIGASDQRVSPNQGLGFYHLLKGAGEEVEMLIFDGEGHPLDGVEASRVGWEAGRDWLVKYRNADN